MLTKSQIEKYAQVMMWGLETARPKRFKKGDAVLLRFDVAAIALAETIQGVLLDRGLNPMLRMGLTSEMERTFYGKADAKQLVFIGPGEKELCEGIDGSIYLHAPDSLTHLADIDSRKIGKAAVARKRLRDILEKREEGGMFGWTLCVVPTDELAKHARLPLKAYEKQVVKACYLDKPDPVQAWKDIFCNVMEIKKWINSMDVRFYHVESEHMDLKIVPGRHRRWIGVSGHNIPSFEIFTSPDWRGTEGRFFADQPSFRSGNYVEKVSLTFEGGTVTKIKAGKGAEFVRKQLSMDRGSSRVGEFSLTDKRFSRINAFMANTLFDENYGGKHGNCHVAVGSSYSDTYDGDASQLTKEKKRRLGFNDSALHWDLVNTESKTVTAHHKDGKNTVLYEDGAFCY